MIQKSSASLQGALFSELKDLLALVGDAKKAKEQLELLSQEVAELKAIYKINQAESEKNSEMIVEIEKKSAVLMASDAKLKEEKELLEKKKNAVSEKEMDLSLLEKKVNQQKAELESEFAVKTAHAESLSLAAAKAKVESEDKSKKADSLIKEYEEKLSKLKAMVG